MLQPEDGAKAYMRHHSVPDEMQRHVQRWYDYAWSRGCMNGGGDINALGLLPDKLKTELALHVNLETLKKVTIFHECEPEFLHDLVLKMRTYIFTPGDLICRKGEVAREMFIIADGLLEVISESGEILSKMSEGDFFGEIGILNMDGGVNKRTADVRSVGYSELIVLSRDDVLSALRDHPEAEILIKEYGHRRLHELGARRRKNLIPEVAAVSRLVENIVGFKKSLIPTETSTCLQQNDGYTKDVEISIQQFSNFPQSESPSLKIDFPTKTETKINHKTSILHKMSSLDTSQQQICKLSSPCKIISRKSSFSGSRLMNEIIAKQDKDGDDLNSRPLTKTITTDTLLSNGSSTAPCLTSDTPPASSSDPLQTRDITVDSLSSPEQCKAEDSEISRISKDSISNQISNHSKDVVRSSFHSDSSILLVENISPDDINPQKVKKESSITSPRYEPQFTDEENQSRIDSFPFDDLSSTISICIRNFFESRLDDLKVRITLLEADNLAKSQQIQVLNSMLEQKKKESHDDQTT